MTDTMTMIIEGKRNIQRRSDFDFLRCMGNSYGQTIAIKEIEFANPTGEMRARSIDHRTSRCRLPDTHDHHFIDFYTPLELPAETCKRFIMGY